MTSSEQGVCWPIKRWRPNSANTHPPRRQSRLGWCAVTLLTLGCESKSVIATWSCPPISEARAFGAAGSPNTADAPGVAGTAGNWGSAGSAGSAGSSQTTPLFEIPWSTGFEDGFCEYEDTCYQVGTGSMRIVSEPVHKGIYAAAFTINKAEPGQARCVRKGILPTAAYYGAWYYVPPLGQNDSSWNLFHFGGDNPANGFHLWDVTLINRPSGGAYLMVFNYWVALPDQTKHPAIPIGAWFHIEMYLKRASDDTGEVRLYQDDALIVQLSNIKTDNSSGQGEWLVGNLVGKDFKPAETTFYVDDVTVRATR